MRGSELSHSEASLPPEAILPSGWERWSPGSLPPPPAPATQPPPPTPAACPPRTSPPQLLGDAAPRARYYQWAGPIPSQAGGVLNCPVCEQSFPLEVDLRTHFHQFHLNPHHLSPQDVRLYRLSNFLVRLHAETEESPKTDFPGLYRCHHCFNLFNQPSSLIQHLATHEKEDQAEDEMPTRTATKVDNIPVKAVETAIAVDQKATKVNKLLSKVEELLANKTDNMPHKVDKLSREDFEDVAPRPKKRRRPERRRQNKRVELSRKSRSLGMLKLESMVVADEMVSEAEDSDSGVETPKESRRPQRECKSRTSTLVAISLAEQEYEQFDLDFARYKSDVNKVSDVDLARMKNINKRVLVDKDNIPDEEPNKEEKDEKLESPSDETNVLNGRSLSPEDDVLSDSKSSSAKEGKSSSKKTDRKRTSLSKSAKARKERKRRKNRSSSGLARKVKLKDHFKSEGEESSTKENDLYDELVELEGLGPEKRRVVHKRE